MMLNRLERPEHNPSEYDAGYLNWELFRNHFILEQAMMNADMAKDELAKKGVEDGSFKSMQEVVMLLEKALKLMEEVEEKEHPEEDGEQDDDQEQDL